MRRINLCTLISIVLIAAWIVSFPALHDYANSKRVLPGAGGETIIPLGIVAVAVICQTAADWKQADSEEDSTNEK